MKRRESPPFFVFLRKNQTEREIIPDRQRTVYDMKKIAYEYEFSPEQLNEAERLASALDLTLTTAKILYARGIDTEEKIRSFLSPSADHFLSPFLMSGMREAVSLLERARAEEWRVAVFGDYDADGIGACAILSRALREYGIEPYIYVPERTEGYGMSVGAIDKIFDEFLPDLFLTVDCGISNRKEVEYIKEQGAYVIVTDHHELPDLLPDCICINPKIKDDYPYDNLCGAGVALKLAQALIGERANVLLDFAALSTVADSVPLLGENRDIVAEGLKLIAHKPRAAFAALLGKTTGEITAQTLAFTVAPRINAAGRMGDAYSALRLFTTEDEREIYELAVKLNAYNAERQQCCDELYAQANAQVRKKGAYGNVIMLVSESWNTGFLGIVAARIAEEYARPALLFVRRGNDLKGSARSVENVNIFDALKGCSEFIEEFGGHAQAAGINIKADQFEALERALNDYIGSHYKREDFIPVVYVAERIQGAFPKKLAKELNALEPYGVGHRRPLFVTEAEKLRAEPIKPQSPHLSVTGGGMEFMYFGGAKQKRLLESDLKKSLIFECNLSRFRGRDSLKGFIRTVVYDGTSGKEAEQDCFENAVLSLSAARPFQAESCTTEQLNALLKERLNTCAYGLCAVASERATLKNYPSLKDLNADLFEPSSGSICNTVLVSPLPDCDLSGYREIVFLDTPACVSFCTGNAKLYCNSEINGFRRLRSLSRERETLLAVFSSLRNLEGISVGGTIADAARACALPDVPEEEVIFALAVFEELGIVTREGGKLRIIRGKKTELTASEVYRACSRLSEEE